MALKIVSAKCAITAAHRPLYYRHMGDIYTDIVNPCNKMISPIVDVNRPAVIIIAVELGHILLITRAHRLDRVAERKKVGLS